MKLNGKVAVMTGAGSGMGREGALLFSQKGYTVACADINEATLNETVTMIKDKDGDAYGIIADVTKIDAIKRLATVVERKSGRVDVLINFVGFLGKIASIVDVSEKDMDYIIDGNLKSTYRCCKYFLPMMIKRKSGIIINISSQSGKLPQPNASIYAAAKAGVISFSKSLELEVKPYGIKVVLINPGSTSSPFHDKREEKYKLSKELMDKFLKPIDFAYACLFVVEQSKNCVIREMDVVPMCESVECVIK